MPELTESEERASNAGFKRGLSAGAAKASNESDSGGGIHAPSAPDFSDDQSMTWELLLILGIVLLLISPVGDWLAGVVREITTHHNMNLTFNPLQTGTSIQAGTGIRASSGGGGGGGGGGGTSLFNVPIVNAAGESGSIQVVAHDAASAVGNASQGGNTPTGPASSA